MGTTGDVRDLSQTTTTPDPSTSNIELTVLKGGPVVHRKGRTKEQEAELSALITAQDKNLTRSEKAELERIRNKSGRTANEQAELEYWMLNDRANYSEEEFPSGERSSDLRRETQIRIDNMARFRGQGLDFTAEGEVIPKVVKAPKTKVYVKPVAVNKNTSREAYRLNPPTKQELDEAGRISTETVLLWPSPTFIGPVRGDITRPPSGFRGARVPLSERMREEGDVTGKKVRETTKKQPVEIVEMPIKLVINHTGSSSFVEVQVDNGGLEGEFIGEIEFKHNIPVEWNFNNDVMQKNGYTMDDVHNIVGDATGANLLHKISQGHVLNFKRIDKRIKAELQPDMLESYNNLDGVNHYRENHEAGWTQHKTWANEEIEKAKPKVRKPKTKKEPVEPFVVETGDVLMTGTAEISQATIDEVTQNPFTAGREAYMEGRTEEHMRDFPIAGVPRVFPEGQGPFIEGEQAEHMKAFEIDDLTKAQAEDQAEIDKSVEGEGDVVSQIEMQGTQMEQADEATEEDQDEDNDVCFPEVPNINEWF
jgi:hypothetical protein